MDQNSKRKILRNLLIELRPSMHGGCPNENENYKKECEEKINYAIAVISMYTHLDNN